MALIKKFKKAYISIEIIILASIVLIGGIAGIGAYFKNGQNAQKQSAEAINDAIDEIGDEFGFPIGGDSWDGIIPDGEITMNSGETIYYKIGSKEVLEFKTDGKYSDLQAVTLDGEAIRRVTDYTVSKTLLGKTNISFTEQYITGMTEGEFEVKIIFEDGSSKANLITTYINAINKDSVSEGYITNKGVINSVSSTFTYTEKIPVSQGDVFNIWKYTTVAQRGVARFVTAYDSKGNVVASAGADSVNTYTVPKGVSYIVFSLRDEDLGKIMALKNTENQPTRFVEYNYEGAGAVAIDSYINIFNKDKIYPGYVTTEGRIDKSSTALSYTDRIVVSPGDKYQLWYFFAGAAPNEFRFVTAYDVNGNVLPEHSQAFGEEYVVPTGVHSLVFTVSTGSAAQTMILKNPKMAPPCYIKYNGNVQTLEVPVNGGFVNIFNYETVTNGYMAPNGSTTGSTSLGYSEKISVNAGETLYMWLGPTTRYAPRFITAFNSEGVAVTSAGSSSPSNTYVVPSGVTDIVVTVYTSSMDRFMMFKNKDSQPPQYIPYVGSSSTPEEPEEPEEPKVPSVINFFDKDTVSSGYMGPNGATSASTSLIYSKKIYVTPGEELSFWNGVGAYSPRFITAFDKDGNALSSLGTNSPGKTYTVPDKVDSVIITVYTSVLNKFMVLKNVEETPTEYVPYDESLIPERPQPEEPEEVDDFSGKEWLYTSGDMSTSTKLSLGKADVQTDKHLVFKATVDSFSGIRIGHGYTEYVANYIEIDETHIRQYFYTSSAQMQKEAAHGLTIKDDLRVTIDVNNRRVATVKIKSNGQTFEFKTSTTWYGSNGEIYAQSLGSKFTDAELAWTCDGYKGNIQFYGDSYLSQSSDRWLYHAFNAGYGSGMIFDAFGGRGSGGAYNSLLTNLEHSNPDIVVWMLGMNDGSDKSGTPSTAWATTRDKLIALSQEKGFELVFTTIPTVPTINHEAKNAWIRSSGYRYIDMAAGVGADGTGAWTSGYLSADGVHPSASGAQAIYNQVIQDFPELKQ